MLDGDGANLATQGDRVRPERTRVGRDEDLERIGSLPERRDKRYHDGGRRVRVAAVVLDDETRSRPPLPGPFGRIEVEHDAPAAFDGRHPSPLRRVAEADVRLGGDAREFVLEGQRVPHAAGGS